ncbi:lytic murein transglycosylase B [Endozoicomonas gorgoniicola]|uniref:Lytic murein transglycosylase B n=1 Tax=Endozoicomonas gorgoniicola TaxID=1234144 RepID=A0ABT3MZJ2_9GAMM|nr:lytic murein transglycosylase B [Endozoicomonas gorgoniicola]MCW7554414.1 lytic murein transglycosylase B [Endozoicomonas gorgoniicola]
MVIFSKNKILALTAGCLISTVMMAASVPEGEQKASGEQSPSEQKASYASTRPEVEAFIKDLVKNEQFSRKEVEALLGKAQKSERVLELISRPAEKRLEWKDYRKIFMTDQRVNEGVDFWLAHAETLAEAEKEYGVPAPIIVAIIGVETYYGRLTGGFKVLDALSTLSFDYPPRSTFFTRQLKEFLILVREQKLDPHELTGSYAGAMGIPQFMPSSYRAYAVDFTGDGQSNIWKQEEDAIGSVANYLKENGWRAGKPIASKAKVQGTKYEQAIGKTVRPAKTLKQLETAGWKPVSVLPSATKAVAMSFEGEKGTEYWLGMENFRVITTYNRSKLYAMAVHQLAKEVNTGYKTTVQKKKTEPTVANKS